MFSFWIVLAVLMADVGGAYHGGDGAGDPPPGPHGFGRSTHEMDGNYLYLFIINIVTNNFYL